MIESAKIYTELIFSDENLSVKRIDFEKKIEVVIPWMQDLYKSIALIEEAITYNFEKTIL